MKDPEVPPLDPSLARLLRSEKGRPGPGSEEIAAMWSGLAGRLPVGPGPGGAPPDNGPSGGDIPSPPAPARSAIPARAAFSLAGNRAVGALLAMFVAGGVTGGAVVYSLQRPSLQTASYPSRDSDKDPSKQGDPRQPEAASSTTGTAPGALLPAGAPPLDSPPSSAGTATLDTPSSSASAAVAASAAPPAGASARAPGAPSQSASVAPHGSSAASQKDVDLAAERSLLDEARAALLRGEGQRCLSTLARHQSEFPGGRLSVEREVLTIQALVVSGRRDEAVRRAQAFRAAHPKSLLWPAVEAAVGPVP